MPGSPTPPDVWSDVSGMAEWGALSRKPEKISLFNRAKDKDHKKRGEICPLKCRGKRICHFAIMRRQRNVSNTIIISWRSQHYSFTWLKPMSDI